MSTYNVQNGKPRIRIAFMIKGSVIENRTAEHSFTSWEISSLAILEYLQDVTVGRYVYLLVYDASKLKKSHPTNFNRFTWGGLHMVYAGIRRYKKFSVCLYLEHGCSVSFFSRNSILWQVLDPPLHNLSLKTESCWLILWKTPKSKKRENLNKKQRIVRILLLSLL